MGWYMVKSGLVDDPRVSHFRLTAHLGLALLIFSLELWIALGLLAKAAPGHLRVFPLVLVGLIFLMALSGGFVAGLRAGHAYNTFPLMNGHLVPPETFMLEPWWRNFLWNVATIQLVHRAFFWLLLVLIPIAWWQLRETRAKLATHHLLGMFGIQATLGVSTLLLSVPIALGAAHQAAPCCCSPARSGRRRPPAATPRPRAVLRPHHPAAAPPRARAAPRRSSACAPSGGCASRPHRSSS